MTEAPQLSCLHPSAPGGQTTVRILPSPKLLIFLFDFRDEAWQAPGGFRVEDKLSPWAARTNPRSRPWPPPSAVPSCDFP